MSKIPLTRLGKTDWQTSVIGFGGYRLHEKDPAHKAALQLALLEGCNLIDTSTNYGDGASEKLIGQVIAELTAEGRLQRDDLFVVSKAGYVQGSQLKLARERIKQGHPYPEMVEYTEDCWHCISPAFLAEALTASLDRLGLKQLDALLLHNPEYFLKAGGEHAEYYRRIQAAFAHLEKEVAQGRIRYYGVSSNTLPEPREAADYTSLETLTEIAEKHGKNHHFAIIQFPFNLYEPGAAFENNNGAQSVLEYARAKDLGTLTNRPLNAFAGRRLLRLADFPSHADRDIVGDFKAALDRTTALEASYPGRTLVPAKNIAWGHALRENFERLADIDTWQGFLAFRVRPVLEHALAVLGGQAEFAPWTAEYRDASSKLFAAVSAYLESQASVKSDRIAGILDHLSPELQTSATLSQKAIRLYRSVPGLDCVLLGMRQTQYVRDAMDLQPPINPEAARCALLELSSEAGTAAQ